MSETQHVRTPSRALLRLEECPKCGTFSQPTWKRKVEEECLLFQCPCGFSWETPPRDAESRNIAGVVLPKGYNLIRDEYAPASPAGFRVVRE